MRYIGTRPQGVRGSHAEVAAVAVAALAFGRWASRGPGGLERVGPSGSAR
jgi:hypothetical protein